MNTCDVCSQPIRRDRKVCDTCEDSVGRQDSEAGFSEADFTSGDEEF
ncbi:MAG: hypothetical protein HY369_03420 [Candidatus Aenigmarchaeota archaeon]|nr:hypothetical protein [Candidatus Aenigmarchaeota archaeon]